MENYKIHNLLLCSHSPNDVPPEPQRNVSIAAVWGAVRPSNEIHNLFYIGLLILRKYYFQLVSNFDGIFLRGEI